MRAMALLIALALATGASAQSGGAPAPAAAAPATPPVKKLGATAESIFLLKQADYRVRITVRPGEPQPGKLVELQVDVSQTRDPPDPTYGDEVPIQDAQLGLTFSGPGTKVRYYLRPLPDVGSYGVHWTPPAKGLWTASLAPLSLTGTGPTLSFELGVGVPMPPSAQGQEVQASRLVLGGRGVKRAQPLTPVMHEVQAHWLRLLDVGADQNLANIEGQRLAELLKSVAGRAPQAFATAAPEFDELARAAATAADGAAHTPFADRPAAMRAVELNSCTHCHVKFRDGVVEDISRWPEVKPWVR